MHLVRCTSEMSSDINFQNVVIIIYNVYDAHAKADGIAIRGYYYYYYHFTAATFSCAIVITRMLYVSYV